MIAFDVPTAPVLPIDQALIGGLEFLLGEAREGNIQGIAYTTIASGGVGSYVHGGTGWAGQGAESNKQALIGYVAILQARLVKATLSDDDE